MHDRWKWLDSTSALATTLDGAAWFLLLLLLELQTYRLSDEAFTKLRVRTMQTICLVCILFFGHTTV